MKGLMKCGIAGLLLPSLFFGGCVSVGPDYKIPDIDLPDAWAEAVAADFTAEQPELSRWWRVFDDPVLDKLIGIAGMGNLNVKLALIRIEESRSLRGAAAAEWLPQVDANASASAFSLSEETNPSMPPGMNRSDTLYSVGASVGWELDLWGRVRRAVESADAGLEASLEDYRDALVVLNAEVALNYVKLRSLQERLLLATDNLKMQQETRDLTINRNKAGLSPELDVQQAEMNLASTASNIPALHRDIAITMHRISVLCGSNPTTMQEILRASTPTPPVESKILVGLPVDLLRRRPDIRAAERRLAAQHARIGVATAELYPTFTLPGSIDLEAFNASSLGSGLTYNLMPKVRWNLFSGGRVRALIGAEKARTEQARLRYENTVLHALEEVENALVSVARNKEREAKLAEAVAAANSSAELVRSLYKSGLTDFQNLLDMERSLTIQQDNLAQSRGHIAAGVVQLYKALGGGWQNEKTTAETEEHETTTKQHPITGGKS